VPVGFIDVPGRHRTRRNTGGPSQTSRRDSLLRGLKLRKVELRVSPKIRVFLSHNDEDHSFAILDVLKRSIYPSERGSISSESPGDVIG